MIQSIFRFVHEKEEEEEAPRAGHPPYYALARPRSSAVGPPALSKREKGRTSKKGRWNMRHQPIPARIILNHIM